MPGLEKYDWSALNKMQVGAYCEYFVKMEMTMWGFQVYGTEVDDRGIDFVGRYELGPFIEVQVKSVRTSGYVFMHKAKFDLRESLYLALGMYRRGEFPTLYLIPSLRWRIPDSVFSSRDYTGKRSRPEWGLNVNKNTLPALEMYRFEKTVKSLIQSAARP